MLFMVAGHLKPDAEERLIDLSSEFNEHLAQSPPVAVGVLRDRDGRRRGDMGFVEAAAIEQPGFFLKESLLLRGRPVPAGGRVPL